MKPIILFNFASRSRPEKFFKTIDNILSKCKDRKNMRIVATIDDDDKEMNTDRCYDRYAMLEGSLKFEICWGKSKNKIDAINRGVPKEGWDILVNVSDDMEFTMYGFDEDIRAEFGGNFDLCLHYPDGNTKEIITMSILGKHYYDRFNYVYHPEYVSLWADNEQTEVAKILGKYRYINKELFSHNHPAFGKAETDQQYIHTESYYYIDKDTYDVRKFNNFGL